MKCLQYSCTKNNLLTFLLKPSTATKATKQRNEVCLRFISYNIFTASSFSILLLLTMCSERMTMEFNHKCN